MAENHWPLFELRLLTERLELRPPTDADLPALADLAAAGVHDPAIIPFEHAWTDQPSPRLERGLYQWNWRTRALLHPEHWTLGFMVSRREDGVPLGVQDLVGRDYLVRRTVETGSWLGLAHQGLGFGKEMRAAALQLAFDGLGAERAESVAWEDNDASVGVSRALGYAENGDRVGSQRGEARRDLRFRLLRTDWQQRPRPAVTIEGLDGARRLLGLVDGDDGAPGSG